MKEKNYIKDNVDDFFGKPLLALILIIGGFWVLDIFDIPSKVGLITKLTSKYDWFSLVGNFLSVIYSVYFLIVVTRMDREDNNENIRQSQRPNLCTRLYLPNNFRVTDTSVEGYIFQTGEEKNTSEYYIIKISNSGQTAAIVDTKKSYIKAHKIEDEMVPIDNAKSELQALSKEYTVYFNKYEDRLHIDSNKEANIVLIDNGLYRSDSNEGNACIDEVYIEYEDLFGKRYIDHVFIKDGKTIVSKDNELV